MTISCLSCRERIAVQRGVCLRCYNGMRRRVQRGSLNWLELEELGLILPSRGGPGKPAASVKAWYGDYRRVR